jgi:hypothetical protein
MVVKAPVLMALGLDVEVLDAVLHEWVVVALWGTSQEGRVLFGFHLDLQG